ncbi:ATP-binding protein [Candidatus Marimicrobium litorale]|uniref:histidine kinase n=1 Tax=Candidatus Marimicrobium litorale TaxID=2518991 RepID=A0ABT3T378_9GAMM|nr:ATP-binding protein [Candidatus Marimicrobium litorale]MCX2976723.1 HAMP domain-containing protein [Candidatus Marimicrobium litorale]
MKLFNSFFIKVFLGFWLVTTAVLGSWLLSSNYYDSRPPRPGHVGEKPDRQPHRAMLRMLYALENHEEASLVQSIDIARERFGIRIFLLNAQGEDLLGRKVPRNALLLADKLQGQSDRPSITAPGRRLTAHRLRRTAEGPISAVFMYPQRQRAALLNLVGDNVWLRLSLAVLVSGGLCFLLSRVITTRIQHLQVASRQLANGALDTRLTVRSRGGDETDELARDFNTMAAQLQERIQAQKRLMGDISHELRSPLARLRVSLALAQKKPAEHQQYLKRIEQDAERLEALIAQLLANQRLNAKLEDTIDLGALLEQLCDNARFEGQQSGKTFYLRREIGPAVVKTHADTLQKAFENILRNALQHTVDNTTVDVTLSNTEGYRVTVEDHGAGVPDDELDKIFTEFYQVDRTRSPTSEGFGLGLAIARRSIALHGGRICADNTASGLRVSVQLPPDIAVP